MASQLEFEGPVLEDLLEKVRAEVGPDARIVAANRIRRGGVGGFFAREAFEVLVEPPDDGVIDDPIDTIADDDTDNNGGLALRATDDTPIATTPTAATTSTAT